MRVVKPKQLLVRKNIPDVLNPAQQSSGIFANASLDLRFAEREILTDAISGRNLITFTRTSRGTYVDSQGVIRTATTNLLLQSEDFSTTWVNSGSSENTNVVIAPNGTLTADVLVDTAVNEPHELNQTVTLAASTTYTFSMYLKQANVRYAALVFGVNASWGTGGGAVAYFDLQNGTVVGTSQAVASIINVGNGWYRCIATATTTASPSSFILRVSPSANGSSRTYTGSGTEAIYIWGAQLEQSSSVGEYIPTGATINSAPRFDHNPITGESLGLLVEEQRTNLLLRSEEFGVSPTWAPTDASITSDTQVAPNGLQTADTYTEAATGTPGIFQTATGLTSSAVYTSSIYLKRGSTDWYRLLFVDNTSFSNGARAWVNLGTGAFGTVENIGTGTGVTSTITPLANGWYRVSLSTAMGGSNTTIRFQINSASANSSASRVLGSAAYLWGAQLEAGAFHTSYIPTTTAAATRSADVCSITGSAFSSWYRQDEGTVFVASDFPQTTFGVAAELYQSSTNNIAIRANSTNTQGLILVDNSAQMAINIANTSRFTGAIAYRANDSAFTINGQPATTDATVQLPSSITSLEIGRRGVGDRYANGTIRRFTYWPARLSNNVLQDITR